MNTITNTNSFSFRRLGEVLKRDIQADKMLYLGLFIASFLLMTYLQVQHFDSHNHLLYIKRGEISKAIMELRIEMFSHSLMALLFYIGVMTATFCNPVRKKQKATSYLMMPVTCAERFVSRVIITIFGTLIMTLLVWLLSDLARMGIVTTFSRYSAAIECNEFTINHTLAALGRTFTTNVHMSNGVTHPLVANYAVIAFYVYSHSLMLLGACIFRNPLAGFLPFAALVLLIYATSDSTFWDDILTVYPVYTVVASTILIIFNWWLSYYHFSRKQIVRRAGYIIKRKEAV